MSKKSSTFAAESKKNTIKGYAYFLRIVYFLCACSAFLALFVVYP
jgi:hypothetical protein